EPTIAEAIDSAWEILMDAKKVKACTFKELGHLKIAYEKRNNRNWEQTREIVAACLNPHLKKAISPKDVRRLLIDYDGLSVKKHIKTIVEADKLLEWLR